MQTERDRVGPTLGLPTSLLQDIEERVWRGAELLDRKRPGWFERIDLSRLTLADCRNCVIGQVCGGYFGRTASGLLGDDLLYRIDLGFDVGEDTLEQHVDAIFSYLGACWTDAVNERRAGA